MLRLEFIWRASRIGGRYAVSLEATISNRRIAVDCTKTNVGRRWNKTNFVAQLGISSGLN